MLTDQQIKTLAREYAEEYYKVRGGTELMADEADGGGAHQDKGRHSDFPDCVWPHGQLLGRIRRRPRQRGSLESRKQVQRPERSRRLCRQGCQGGCGGAEKEVSMEIDIKTLHIGAHINVNGKRERVRGLDEDNGLMIRFPAEYVNASEVEPIPITSALLEELGFEERRREYPYGSPDLWYIGTTVRDSR